MPDSMVCGKCGARYNVSQMKPGTKFRCRGADCGEVLAVGDAGGPPRTDDRTPTAVARRGDTGRRAAAGAPVAAAAPVEEEEGRRGRGRPGSGRRGRGEEEDEGRRGRGPAPKKSNTGLIVAAIGGGVLVVGLLAFLAFSGGGPPPEKSKKGGKRTDETAEGAPETKPAEAKASEPEKKTETAKAEDGGEKKETKKSSGRSKSKKKEILFVEDPAGARAKDLIGKVSDEDPSVSEPAKADIKKMGRAAVSTMLNHLTSVTIEGEKEMELCFQTIELIKEILGADLGEKLSNAYPEVEGSNPMAGRIPSTSRKAREAMKKFWAENGGKVAEG